MSVPKHNNAIITETYIYPSKPLTNKSVNFECYCTRGKSL